MAIGIGIGLRIGKSGNNGLLLSIKNKLLFLGYYSQISEGKMSNILGSDWLTVSGSVGSESYQCPNTSLYIAADTDYIWFKTDSSQRFTTTSELVEYDFSRTFVKYQDNTPYSLQVIAIAKSGETFSETEMNAIRDYFHLSIWWDNTLSSYGNLKGNRGIGRSVFTPESVAPNMPTGLTLSLISGGVMVDWTDTNAATAQTEIWSKIDAGSYVLSYTIANGVATKNDLRTPYDLITYKIRALKNGLYSAFTTEASIAMLGVEKISNGGFDSDTLWVKGDGYTIAGGLLNCNASNYALTHQACGLVLNETYKIELDLTRTSGLLTMQLGAVQSSGNYGVTGKVTWTVKYTKSGGNNRLYLVANSTLVGSIDNITVKKILMP